MTQKVSVGCATKELESLHLSARLSLILGYEPMTNVLNRTGTFPSNILLGIPSQLFVYTDIIEPQAIGDVFAKVLRVVVVDSNNYTYGAQMTRVFGQPHYVPVLKREFENIQIDIRSSTGDLIPFQFGTLCVKLHFKKN